MKPFEIKSFTILLMACLLTRARFESSKMFKCSVLTLLISRRGVITNLELLTAQTNLQNAQLGKIQLEYKLLLSKLDLNRIGGTRFW